MDIISGVILIIVLFALFTGMFILGIIVGYNNSAKEYDKYKILAEAFDEFQEFIEKEK